MNKILIVDDSATMRKILMRAIRQAGVECDAFFEAANGAEGLERLNAEASIDVVLSDVNMPVMNGIDFVKAVRAQAQKNTVPILMVTTEGGEAMLKTAMEAGASGYVTKPFTPETLKSALNALGK
jgi:two-component system, chemotaxis family, chemotaxis protein CheY